MMINYDLFDMPREKYWAPPASYSREKIRALTDQLIESGNYLCSEKIDGNWCAFIVKDGVCKMQTRGRSTVTGKYGEVQDKVPHIFETLKIAFEKAGDTFIIGELYSRGGNDKEVGSILRCLPPKAIERQKDESKKLHFYIFDAWHIQGQDLMDKTLLNRVDYICDNPGIAFALCNNYIHLADYYEAKDSAYWLLDQVFARGGEGIVLQRKDGKPEPDKRPARKSLKIKKEIQNDMDVICTGWTKPTREYNGIAVEFWAYWQNIKTGELIHDHMYVEYMNGAPLEPITRLYYYGWPGSIECSVWQGDELVKVCDVSGLTDELREDLVKNFDKYFMKPLRITGMEVTNPKKGEQSIRHPKFMGFRDDIDNMDCRWEKIFG